MGAFGERMRDALAEPMEALFSDYEEALDAWPIALGDPAAIHLEGSNGITLEDWLGELRQDDAGNRCRLLLLSSSLIKNSKYQWHLLLRHWVAHLAGNLSGPMTTQRTFQGRQYHPGTYRCRHRPRPSGNPAKRLATRPGSAASASPPGLFCVADKTGAHLTLRLKKARKATPTPQPKSLS